MTDEGCEVPRGATIPLHNVPLHPDLVAREGEGSPLKTRAGPRPQFAGERNTTRNQGRRKRNRTPRQAGEARHPPVTYLFMEG